MPNQVDRVFDSACSPQRTAVQGRAQSSWSKLLGGVGQLDGPFDESRVHLDLNQAFAKGHQCPFAERRLLGV